MLNDADSKCTMDLWYLPDTERFLSLPPMEQLTIMDDEVGARFFAFFFFFYTIHYKKSRNYRCLLIYSSSSSVHRTTLTWDARPSYYLRKNGRRQCRFDVIAAENQRKKHDYWFLTKNIVREKKIQCLKIVSEDVSPKVVRLTMRVDTVVDHLRGFGLSETSMTGDRHGEVSRRQFLSDYSHI